ncbi:MAG TPA: efflux RND transporter periplasmic adaptor subunit [Candidatus Binataceae bacterium]|jgi:Cu(I)/Ag(I) efflux system membrane fusion protein/cobalt-zinc-cadmium efflux system membrane fusion protein|nr:efflux RND transporter periplasmic adaptor subunit [Candidatus Binataceae bacterium]
MNTIAMVSRMTVSRIPMRAGRKRARPVLVAIALAASALAAVVACFVGAPDAGAQTPAATSAASAAPALAPVQIDARRRQLIGLRLATVVEAPLVDRIETTGTIVPDERLQGYVQTRFAGWIRRVFADQTYAYVRRGQPLFTIYSPDIASTEREYLLARRASTRLGSSPVEGVAAGAASLADAALDRLRQAGVPAREVARLQRSGTARQEVEIDAPMSGYVVERAALPNMYVQPETRLYTIAGLTDVWVYAALFQNRIAEVKAGDPVSVRIDSYPGEVFAGRVDFIWPAMDEATRTVKVRCVLPNPQRLLKPGMFVRAAIEPRLGRGLVIPDSGVLRTGMHDIVFVDRGGGNLQPVEVRLGPHLDGRFVVQRGLRAGQRIVSSANFLVDSESQLQAALGTFEPPPPGVGEAAEVPSASIELATEPSPPRKGDNQIRVTLRDAEGRAVNGAEVSLVFLMAAMPSMGMAAMRETATAREAAPGTYTAHVTLPSGGSWQVSIVARKGGATIAQRQLNIAVAGAMQ